MIFAFLLAAGALLAQDVPALTNQNGTVVGILRNAAGAPAAGVRVSAMTRPDTITDLLAASAFAALAETDSAGRYRLENVPPGRYYIVAGRVDAPTYYPGTVQPSEGAVVQITPGISISGIDFVLNNGSVGRANADLGGVPSYVVPIQTRIEGGGKVPVFSSGRFPMLRFMRNPARTDVPLNAPSVTLLEPGYTGGGAPPPEYRVTVENLPANYELKSLTFGSTDLLVDTLQLPRMNSGSTVTQPVMVTLAVAPSTPPSGARISGRIQGDVRRSIFISGHAGTVYSDGTFEFIGVQPGRHNIVSLDSPIASRFTGTTLIVGDRDLANVELAEISIPPANSDQPALPSPAGDRLPGFRIPPASIHGTVLDAGTREPFNAGKVVVNGNYSYSAPLNDEGRFDIPKLLPGRYMVEVIVYGIGAVTETVILDEQDSTIELTLIP
jgi:hypothetical protein